MADPKDSHDPRIKEIELQINEMIKSIRIKSEEIQAIEKENEIKIYVQNNIQKAENWINEKKK